MRYFLSFTLISLTRCSLDSPIVIERPHQPEWQDLTLEYKHEEAPERNMTIKVSTSIVTSRYLQDGNSVQLVLDLTQQWDDRRIKFRGTETVPVPSFIKLWLPDTVVDNSIRETVRLESLHVSPQGIVILRQRRDLEIVCREQVACPLILRSFANKGADSVQYVEGSDFAPNSTVTGQIISNGVLYNTLEVAVTNLTNHYSYSL